MNKAKYMIAYMLIICITLAACGGSTNSDAPKQDAVVAETTEAMEGVTAPPASDGAIASHDPTQEERREEMQKADSEDAPMPYQSDPDTEQEGRREEVQKADEERWQEEVEDEPGEGEWHEVDGVRFYTEHRLDDFLELYPDDSGQYSLSVVELLRAIWGDEGTILTSSGEDYDGSYYLSFSRLSTNPDIMPGMALVTRSKYDKVRRTVLLKIVVSRVDSSLDCCSTVKIPDAPVPLMVVFSENEAEGLTLEMAELLLYILEQTQQNPRDNIAGELGLTNYVCGNK